MHLPFNMPDEYLQGFLKGGQNWLKSMACNSALSTVVANPAQATPLAQLQLDYLQQQWTLWTRLTMGATAGEPLIAHERGDGALTPPSGVTTRFTVCTNRITC